VIVSNSNFILVALLLYILLMYRIYTTGQPHSIMADKGSEFESVSARMDLIQMCSVFNQVKYPANI
jgi:hypothetical protein